MHPEARPAPPESVVVVGCGPIGIACAIAARRRGLDPLVVEAGAIADAIVRYPIGMTFFTTPELLEVGGHPLVCGGAKPTREEALKYYREVVRREEIRVETYTRLTGARRDSDRIVATVEDRSGVRTIATDRLVLATGYFGHPRMLGIPGEDLPHVSHYFDEGHRWSGRDVVVIGGRNSAAEAALELFRAGARVTVVHRGTAFGESVKYWVRPDLENRIAGGEIAAYLGARVRRIDAATVTVRTATGEDRALPADRVFALTGFIPDEALLERIGIVLEGDDRIPVVDPATHETNVPGVHLAGSLIAGRRTSQIFIENGRFDGELIFGAE